MKPLIAAILLIQLINPVYAHTYIQDGVLKITLSNQWTSSSAAENKKQTYEAINHATKHSIKIDANIIHNSNNLTFYKQSPDGSGIFILRTMTGPAEISKDDFENLSPSQISVLTDSIAENQNTALLRAGTKLIATETSISSFSGIPTIETKKKYYNAKGFLVSSSMHVFYRDTLTLILSLEHISKNGNANHNDILNDISEFNFIAE